ncbi:hypothetical protein DKX38_029436 [Salix brachista]|uniref:Uncharacterized protein n=1 Tax=Salix brachista TaxID=2182728 RepID=A0A5N5IZ46_9ROSI|nr:hypothetical protein DKX38_029436 [Salix brachista]
MKVFPVDSDGSITSSGSTSKVGSPKAAVAIATTHQIEKIGKEDPRRRLRSQPKDRNKRFRRIGAARLLSHGRGSRPTLLETCIVLVYFLSAGKHNANPLLFFELGFFCLLFAICALVVALSAGDQGIISLAFGCTRLFQPDKPVTKAQAVVALATESVVQNAVSAHNTLVAQVEQDINASFEKELSMEREKINAAENMAEEVRSRTVKS